MKFKILFLLTTFIMFSNRTYAQADTSRINKKRIFIVGGSLASATLGTYLYIQNAWWSDDQVPFHFDDGADMVYAKNVDKLGHLMGGLQAADIFTSSMLWAGMSEENALWYGAAFGSSLQLAIEIKDAYAPYWGFSKLDLAFGAAGSLFPVIQFYNNNFKDMYFKFSYYKRSDIYWQLERERGKEISKYAWQDDYPNQTYWLAIDISKFIENSLIPEWLNLAVGFGLDDSQYLNENNTKKGGKNEWYIALDYDIPKILKKWDTPLAKNIKHWLNYIHFPAPTLRISPKVSFYPLFL